jgi:D-alanyl-D-alanine carboxypeptidase
MTFVPTIRIPVLAAAFAATILTSATPARAGMEATLLIEADSGKVLHAENATMPWYPASTSKLMTLYVTLQAVKQQRITLDTLFTVSARAASQAPSKIGFKPGTQVTVDNALKILMVKSANDMAVVLAEGVSGSVEKFSSEMNSTSQRLGMTQSNWVNPNGLPADEQISSARDLAILARSLIHDFPEYDMYWHIPAIQLGKKYMRNFNTLIGRYEGADGMKTGFICASGFNLVASASRNGKRLIAVVLGAPSSPYRAAKAAGLLERGFNRGPLSWLSPSLGTVNALQPVSAAPPDLRDEMCGPHRKRPAAEEADEDDASTFLLSNLPGGTKGSALLKDRPDTAKAIAVFVGAAKDAAASQFANARAKIQKLAKGRHPKGEAKTATAPEQPATDAKATALAKPLPELQTVTPPPAHAFTPAAGKREQAVRRLPTANEVNPALSYAPTAKNKKEPAPLTAMPDAKPEPKSAAKPAATAAATPTSKPKEKPEPKSQDKTQAKTQAKPHAKQAPVKPKPAHDAKQAAAAKPDASTKQ